MKIKLEIIAVIILISVTTNAQKYGVSVTGGFSYQVPVSSLNNRFLSAAGFFFGVGENNKQRWNWSGTIEYISFGDANAEKFTVTKEVQVNTNNYSFNIPLKNIRVELEIAGLSADVSYKAFDFGFLNTDFSFGFGIYRWYSYRSGSFDSLFVTNPETSQPLLAAVLKVPELTQTDWSGGINLGVEIKIPVYAPFTLYFSPRYKLVIGELWPSLEIGFENISGFQMLDMRAGVKAEF